MLKKQKEQEEMILKELPKAQLQLSDSESEECVIVHSTTTINNRLPVIQ
jgi:hypothetical protein